MQVSTNISSRRS